MDLTGLALAMSWRKLPKNLLNWLKRSTQKILRKITEEFGDLLFSFANLARHLKIDPEAALRGANAKIHAPFQNDRRWSSGAGKDP